MRAARSTPSAGRPKLERLKGCRPSSSSRLLGELIAIPSVNPAFLPEADPRVGEKAVAEYLAALASSVGLPVELRDVVPGRPNFLTRLTPPGKPRHRVVFAPHMDTVGLPGAWTDLLQPTVRAGRIYGR